MAQRSKLIIGTRPGERPFKLKIDPPDRVYLPWTKGSTFRTTINLSNPTKQLQMYKIKCTDNNVFRVQPPLGFLEAAATVEVNVYQSAKTRPEENKHFIMFLHHVATDEDKNSKKDIAKVWRWEDAAADGVTRVQAHFDEPPKGAGGSKTPLSTRTSRTKTSGASVEDKKSVMAPVTAMAPSKADDKKTAAAKPATPAAKKKAVRKKDSSNSKDKTSNTAEEKTTF